MTITINSEQYADLEHCTTIVQLEAAEVEIMKLQPWQQVSATYLDSPPFDAIITKIEDYGIYCSLSLQRLRFEWDDQPTWAYCVVIEKTLVLSVEAYGSQWRSSIETHDGDSLRCAYSPHRTQAQLQAEAMLMELTKELCGMMGGIFYVP